MPWPAPNRNGVGCGACFLVRCRGTELCSVADVKGGDWPGLVTRLAAMVVVPR